MKLKRLSLKLLSLSIVLIALLAFPWDTLKADTPEITGYFQKSKWISRNKLVNQYNINYSKFNIINYAFYGVNPDGTLFTDNVQIDDSLLNGKLDFTQVPPVKIPNTSLIDLAHKNKVKVLLSIGGPGQLSANFSAVAADPLFRGNFALYCKMYVNQFKFDGVDLYWDSPSPADANNLTLLLMAVKDSLLTLTNGTSEDKLITLASGGKLTQMNSYQWFAVKNLVYAVNLNAYDYMDKNTDTLSFNSPLYSPLKGDKSYSVDSSFRFLISNFDITAKKINLGLNYYGKAFQTSGIPTLYSQSNKLYDTVTFPTSMGMPPYYEIISKLSLYDYNVDALTKSQYLTGKQTLKSFVTFEDQYSLSNKADYVIANSLKGVTIWDITADCIEKVSAPGTYTSPLTDTLFTALTAPRVYISALSNKVLCPGNTLTVSYKFNGLVDGTSFIAMLSDSNGAFINPTITKEVKFDGVSMKNFTLTLPRDLAASNKYKIKIVKSGSGNFDFVDYNNNITVLPGLNITILGSNTACINDVKTYKTKVYFNGINWMVNGGTIIKSSSDSLVVKWDSAASHSVIATGFNGQCLDSIEYKVAVNSVLKPTIIGATQACVGDLVGYKAGVNVDANCIWITENGTVVPGQFNPAVAIARWTKAGKNKLTLVQYYGNSCLDSVTVMVDVVDKTSSAVTKSFKDTVVLGSTYTLNAVKGAGNLYKWAPNNLKVNGATLSDTLNITFDKEGVAGIGLKVTNASGCIDSTGFSVVVIKLLPASITGPAFAQLKDVLTYSVPAEANCSYVWEVDNNYGNIVGSSNTNTINVKWNKYGEGYVKVVKSHNSSDWKSTQKLPVVVETADYAIVIGKDSVCVGNTVEYKILSSKFDKFTWSVGDYGSIYGSNVGSKINVDWLKQGYVLIRVLLESSKISGQYQTDFAVNINPLPIKPTIKLEAGKLVCTTSPNTFIDWYLDGVLISPNGPFEYVPHKSGNYVAKVTNLFGCSDSSAKFNVDMTGVNDSQNSDAFVISPNPNSGKFEIKGKDILAVELFNSIGNLLKSESFENINKTTLNYSDLNSGVYFVKISTLYGVYFKEINVVK